MKKRGLKFLGFGLIMIIYLAFAQIFGNKRAKKSFDNFYKSEINGSINEIGLKYHGVCLRINHDSNEYVFYPYTSILNNKKIFDHLATKGDSVFKPKYQDTLILIKEGKRYLYTFQKFK